MDDHIVFYDAQCPFCRKAVQHIIEIDKDKKILFAPLNGETANKYLTGPQEKLKRINSLIFVEDTQSTHREYWTRSKAILRIYWLIGNGWGLLGIFSFLPSFFIDPFYIWFAAHRHQFKFPFPEKQSPPDRFLP